MSAQKPQNHDLDYEIVAVDSPQPTSRELRDDIVSELSAIYGLREDFITGANTVVLAALHRKSLHKEPAQHTPAKHSTRSERQDHPGSQAGPDPLNPNRSQFPSKRLAGFGVFHDLYEPHEHIGNGLDLEAAQALSTEADVGMFRIALLHSCRGPQSLGRVAHSILQGSRRIFAHRFANHALVIPLLEKANAKAFPLYEKLGFKPRGVVSHLLQVALQPHAAVCPKAQGPCHSIAPNLEVVFCAGLRRLPVRGLARCYARVFFGNECERAFNVSLKMMSSLLHSPSLHRRTSFIVRRPRSHRVVGFLLSERTASETEINITVVGLDRKYRAQGVPVRCFPLFARRCIEQGVTRATQMTSRANVVRLVRHYLGGTQTDRLIWMIRAG